MTALFLSPIGLGLLITTFLSLLCVLACLFKCKQIRAHSTFIQQQHEIALQDSHRDLLAARDELEDYRERLLHNQGQLGELSQKASQLSHLQRDYNELKQEFRDQQGAYSTLMANHEALTVQLNEVKKANEEKIALLEDAEKRLQGQFENLANKIFEQKSETFSKLNQTGISAVLEPLKLQIDTFRKQISEQHSREGQERASLKTEILSLKELNKQITEEAAALTRALKGDNKQQGNWGEVVLDRILQQSGLREGHEYDTQTAVKDDKGKRQMPDVVVHLPNSKDVIIDAKVSLRAYEQFFNAADDSERERLLKDHVLSLKQHIKGLGQKRYQDLKDLQTLDYVLMFVPVEPAFLLAVQEAPELVSFALDNNIMLVSPTNLLVALKTINNIWQYEYQHQNAQQIAEHAAKLYDKFVGFVTDLDKVGKGLASTQKQFEQAMNKLSEGRGNLVRQVEHFKTLGVQPGKKMPVEFNENVGNLGERDPV